MELYCSYDNFLLCCLSFLCVLKIYDIERVVTGTKAKRHTVADLEIERESK